MSRFTKVLVALLVITAFAVPAMAIEADLKGYFQMRGVSYDNLDFDDDADDTAQGVDQRMRLWFTGALNENVKGVFAIEVDHYWGDGDLGTYGADEKGKIEVKSSYIDFNLPDYSLQVKAGTQGFSQGRGFIIADDATGMQFIKKMDGLNLSLMWIKAVEGDKYDDAADVDYYSAQVDFMAGDFTLVPVVGYLAGPSADATNFIYGISADGKAGDIGLAMTLIANNWETATTDGAGLVAFAKASMGFGGVKVSAEAAYMGDSDAADGQFQDVSNYNNFSEVLTGGKFDNRGTIANQAVGDTYMNWIYAKIAASTKVSDKASVDAALIYAKEAEDTAAGDARTFGIELDAYYNRTLVEGLTLTVGGGYLIADEDANGIAGVDADNAFKVGSALTYKF